MGEPLPLFSTDRIDVHNGAELLSREPLTVRSSTLAWAYAVSLPPDPVLAVRNGGTWQISLSVRLDRGEVGVGCLRTDGTAFLKEIIVRPTSDETRVLLRLPADGDLGPLVIRNAAAREEARVAVFDLRCEYQADALPVVADIAHRDVRLEARPQDGGIDVFDDARASSINRGRMDWISALRLPVAGRRVLDVGSGVGHFSQYYVERGATVVALDGRAENIAELSRRLPGVDAHVMDVQSEPLDRLGTFDIVHCFGLLYHLDSPVAALRRMQHVCTGVLLLETIVCDSVRPVMLLADETRTVNQALAGVGCRPSPAFVVLSLNRVGFRHVYGTTAPPDHEDFRFDMRDNLEWTRDGHNLRCVFVASAEPLHMPALVPLIS